MAAGDDDRFRARPAPPKGRGGSRPKSFVSRVLQQVSKAGSSSSRASGARPASTFGRGRVAAGMTGNRLGVTARRVVIKSRYVVLKKAGSKAVVTHLRYIERDGVTRDGQRGQAYGAESDAVDLKGFEERGRGDRHQFRFIVSVEDADQIEDLRSYTRELMRSMATDLETKLDWVAVDHWDTDNPHTHVVLRGRAANRQDLVIAPDYMAHGMRMRASALATQWLGPRTEREIQQSVLREVGQERLTGLDRVLLRQAVGQVVDLTKGSNDRPLQTALTGRLQRLEAMALAERIDANRWRLSPGMESTLIPLGERGDILRAMHKALQGQQRECVMPVVAPAVPVIGRIAGKGLSDELNERAYLVIDGVDGRAHYAGLPAGVDLAELPLGGVVEIKAPSQGKAVDSNIAAIASGGVYRTAEHLDRLVTKGAPDAPTTVEVHVRRLEALRRAGVVERVTDGLWKIPPDFVQKAVQHDAARAAGTVVELHSHLPIERQVRAVGATWLDRQLVGGGGELQSGFGAQVRDALHQRVEVLAEQGLAERRGQRVILARNLLVTLRQREIARVGKAMEQQTGQRFRSVHDGDHVSGVYRRSVQLDSGRFAMLDDGVGFSLVPWRPVMEPRLGAQLSGVVRGTSVSWSLGRQRGVGL